MRAKIDCFLPCRDLQEMTTTIQQMRGARLIHHIFLLVDTETAQKEEPPVNCSFVVIDRVQSEAAIKEIEKHVSSEFVLLYTKPAPLMLGLYTTQRMVRAASEMDAAMVYGDRYVIEQRGEGCVRVAHPVIDYQKGSVRDDFDFGSLLLVRSSLLHRFVQEMPEADYQYAGLYALRLFLSRQGMLFHLNEYLYTEQESDLRASGVKQFDYVNPANREVQIEMEKAVTAHLKAIGAVVDTNNYLKPDFNEQEFEYEASVIIPVYNREKTIADAVNSALGQKTNFKYNVIVVDNHSTDGTSDILYHLAADKEDAIVVIVPDRDDLGIGGCWNLAVHDEHCGRFAVQLDSDDLYSSPGTLQRIVDEFHQQKAAMIVGSYRMCDFNLNTLPPGLISHAEWTDENGPNNALRINGLGAPRAFFTPLLRQIKFPNTSYGEDYALGLAFSRRYRIGRIYDELYLCRRWGGNSDAALSVEKVNANNLYKDRLRTMEVNARQRMVSGKADIMTENSLSRFFNRQLETWETARQHFRDLHQVETRDLPLGETTLKAQFNPARMVSTGAKIDQKSIAARPCFLCAENRPEHQMKKSIDHKYELLVNPFPILPTHYTIPMKKHQPQAILENYGEIHKLLGTYPDLMVFYNGPKCGASAPDHMHFQAGTSGILPLQEQWQRLSRNLTEVVKQNEDEGVFYITDYPAPALLIKSRTRECDEKMFGMVYRALEDGQSNEEPPMNILCWRHKEDFLSVVFLRKKHRPDCYTAEGDDQILVSPGALDMAGLLITPREEDFHKLTPEKAVAILKEVSLSESETASVMERLRNENISSGEKSSGFSSSLTVNAQQPTVSVGIVSAEKITFILNKPYIAKGEVIEGLQIVEFSEGGILWNGNPYHELKFKPQCDEASFTISDVTIGLNFHWERKEEQTFQGTLNLVVEADKICAINELSVERYLMSVISSEMSATSSLEFLKAHAVISRSWLLAQMEKRKRQHEGGSGFFSFVKKDDELIRWYDRNDHTIFDVCADDHCQRYQGITKANNKHVEEAVKETKGQILMYEGEICDARFSKCCGGITEEFQYCWDDTPKPYLVSIKDRAVGLDKDFCNTSDMHILSQVLNDYDQETQNFYRWTVEYTQEELARLIREKLKMDLGRIISLEPLERGKSGRIWKLKIVGTERTFTIGKELEIRRTLSETHLLSSAFDVETSDIILGVPQKFILHGKGWGHGVGLCQIGAAVMGEKGYKYDEILLHYYRNAEIKKIYK